jgi:hypothetical protein
MLPKQRKHPNVIPFRQRLEITTIQQTKCCIEQSMRATELLQRRSIFTINRTTRQYLKPSCLTEQPASNFATDRRARIQVLYGEACEQLNHSIAVPNMPEIDELDERNDRVGTVIHIRPKQYNG